MISGVCTRPSKVTTSLEESSAEWLSIKVLEVVIVKLSLYTAAAALLEDSTLFCTISSKPIRLVYVVYTFASILSTVEVKEVTLSCTPFSKPVIVV